MALGTQLPSLVFLRVRFSCRPYPSIASMAVSNSGLTFSKVSEPQHKENGYFPIFSAEVSGRTSWPGFGHTTLIEPVALVAECNPITRLTFS